MTLRFFLNGAAVDIPNVDPNTTLLSLLRARGLTGTKEGCAEGECGACAVVLTRSAERGGRFEAVHACLTLAHAVDGLDVRTVEGAANGDVLHPVQQALIDHGASQCGYCTPGFVMSLWAEYYRPGREEIDLSAISGNLCRCTGYRPIRDAARALPPVDVSDPQLAYLREYQERGHTPRASSSAPFFHPTRLSELFEIWHAQPDATLIAGGTDVVSAMNQKLERHRAFISLERVAELREVHEDAHVVRLGAAVTLSEIERSLHTRVRALDTLWPLFGSPLVRARATLGGNLGTASPIGDASPVLIALDAEVCLSTAQGTRTVPVCELFTGYRKTALLPFELITEIRVPKPCAPFTRFYKVSKRVSDDISSVAGAFAFEISAGVITKARVAYGGVASRPVRLRDVEEKLVGSPAHESTFTRALDTLTDSIAPIDDVRATARYRLRAASALLRRVGDDLVNSTRTPIEVSP